MIVEQKVRELIAKVAELRELSGDNPNALATANRIERELGSMLPPIRGRLKVPTGEAGVGRRF